MLALGGCEKLGVGQQKAAGPPQRPPARVVVASASVKDVPVYLDEIGHTLAIETVSIMPQVGGKLVAAHVNDGDFVHKGQLLFEIDPRPFQAALDAAQATLEQNRADLGLAQAELKRDEEATAVKGAVSQLKLDQDKSAVAVAEAKVKSAEAAIESAKLNLEYTKISCPIDGRAGARMVDPGNVIKALDKAILNIQQLNPIYAEFTIPENDLGTVRKYLAASGKDLADSPEKQLRVEVDIPANSARVLQGLGSALPTTLPTAHPTTRRVGPREGSLSFMDNSVQNGTGTIRLRATLPNADGYFWPGQFVSVRLVLATKKDAVIVPEAAQQIGQTGPFVYVVNEEGVATIRPIKPGQRQNGNMLVVDQGLEAGEKVIVQGHMQVIPGGKVQAVNQGQSQASPVAAAKE